MTDLIERLEAAEGPCRELMIDVGLAVFGKDPDSGDEYTYPEGAWFNSPWRRFGALIGVEAWEQAALVLVPEGWDYTLYSRGEASVHRSKNGRRVFHDAKAQTPALSICIATLKARAQGDQP